MVKYAMLTNTGEKYVPSFQRNGGRQIQKAGLHRGQQLLL